MDPMTRWEAAAMRGRDGRPRPGTGDAIDLRWSWSTRPAEPSGAEPEPEPEPEPDTLLVPIDAWNRMLAQLGNLHEAGRDLSDARERAARAETEAEFLRERVHDLRDRLAAAEAPPTSSSAPVVDETGADETVADPSDSAVDIARVAIARPVAVVRSTYTRWRARRPPRP